MHEVKLKKKAYKPAQEYEKSCGLSKFFNTINSFVSNVLCQSWERGLLVYGYTKQEKHLVPTLFCQIGKYFGSAQGRINGALLHTTSMNSFFWM